MARLYIDIDDFSSALHHVSRSVFLLLSSSLILIAVLEDMTSGDYKTRAASLIVMF